MRQELTGTGFGQTHEMLNFQVMVKFRLFVRRQWGLFLPLDQFPNPIARSL